MGEGASGGGGLSTPGLAGKKGPMLDLSPPNCAPYGDLGKRGTRGCPALTLSLPQAWWVMRSPGCVHTRVGGVHVHVHAHNGG